MPALIIGLIGVVLLCAVTPYNNFYLKGTFLYGNHLPVGALFLWLVLGQVVNPLLRRFLPRTALTGGELLLIWAMWTAGACLAGSGLWRMLAPSVAAPAYFAGQGNGSALAIFANAPAWLLLSRDPNDPNVQGYWNGSADGSVPWLAWAPVLLGWGIGFACLAAFGIGMTALLRRRWQEAERLSYPLARIPMVLSEQMEPGAGGASRSVRAVLSLGVAAVLMHHIAGTAHRLYPALPDVPTAFSIGNPTDPPWNAIGIGSLEIYFAAIGAVFLLPSDIAFSLWFLYLMFHLLRVLRVATGFEPVMSGPLNQEGAMGVGVFVAWTVTLLWGARHHLRSAWIAAFGNKVATSGKEDRDESSEVMPYRMAFLLTGAGFFGLIAWLGAAGLPPFGGGLAIALTIAVVVFVLSRIMAESGMLFLMIPFGLLDAQRALGGMGISPDAMGTAHLANHVLAGDVREHPIPALTNGFSLANSAVDSEGRHTIPPAYFAIGAALAMFVGYVVGGAANLSLAYHYGEVSLDLWSGLGSNYGLRTAAAYGQALAPGAGGGMSPGVLGWAGVGAASTVLLGVLRSNFLGWPLAPIGLALAGTYAMDRFFFSVFLGWLFKSLFLRWGGAKGYQGAVPFFLGLIVGEAVFAGIAAVFGLLTGIACPPFLPT